MEDFEVISNAGNINLMKCEGLDIGNSQTLDAIGINNEVSGTKIVNFTITDETNPSNNQAGVAIGDWDETTGDILNGIVIMNGQAPMIMRNGVPSVL